MLNWTGHAVPHQRVWCSWRAGGDVHMEPGATGGQSQLPVASLALLVGVFAKGSLSHLLTLKGALATD